jgi:molecular chaperone Hsp33
VQALPPKGAQTETQQQIIERFREHLRTLPPLSTLFKEDQHSLRQVLERIAPGKIQEDSITKIPTDFHCRCSKDQFKKALIAIGPKELDSLLSLPEEERDTLKCYYCAKEYVLDQNDVDSLRTAIGPQGQ